jgi:hypothetical protein
MNSDRKIEELDAALQQSSESEKNETDGADGEFKITVRKLEMPVQPRGVLAE